MKKQRLALTELGESQVEARHLLAIIQDTLVSAHNSGLSGSPMYAFLCGAINSLSSLGYIEIRDTVPPPPGTGPDAKNADPPSFFLDAYKETKKEDDEDGDGGTTAKLP